MMGGEILGATPAPGPPPPPPPPEAKNKLETHILTYSVLRSS